MWHKGYFFVGLVIFICLSGCVDNQEVKGPYPDSGLASWYSSSTTASGEEFNDAELTCALRKKDFGKYYQVCNTENNKCVVVRHNNFGPARRMFNRGRIVDLSKAAFSKIADLDEGLVKITLQQVPPF